MVGGRESPCSSSSGTCSFQPPEPELLSTTPTSSEIAVNSSTARMLVDLVPSKEGQGTVFKLVPSVPAITLSEQQVLLPPTASLSLALAWMTKQPSVISAVDPKIMVIGGPACLSEILLHTCQTYCH